MAKGATVERSATVEISEMEYNSLKAATELLRHPAVLFRTIEAVGRDRGQSLEDAFEARAEKRHVPASA